ncbi:MAG: hypothetical protein ACPLYX_09610 [Rectinema subterraneum]|uniref:hypothetical protein n=1 Tax=Rectinema subterraneum TaxID=2653714 RepID=UPI003C7B6BA4
MSDTIRVRIIAPPAAPNAYGNTWENAAQLIASRLIAKYPGKVQLVFIPLFSKEFFAIPHVARAVSDGSAELPIILVEDRIIQSGGKISESKIRAEIEAILLSS